MLPDALRLCMDVIAQDIGGTGGWLQESQQETDRRGLARTGWAKQTKDDARWNLEIDSINCAEGTEGSCEILGVDSYASHAYLPELCGGVQVHHQAV